MTDAGTTPQRFLERFYGEGNDLRLSEPGLARALEPWTRRVLEYKDQLLLPCQRDGKLIWYAIARNARDARVLREELLAAVGPSYTDFRGIAATLRRSDPIDSAVLDFRGQHVFKLAVVDLALKDRCRQALKRMLDQYDSRPPVQSHSRRLPGIILRDFELALQQQDRDVANAAIEELRAGGFLNGQNLRFIEIRLWEVFGEWAAIRKELDEGTVLRLRRPARITQALLRAVYQDELTRYELRVQVRDALEHFRQLLPRIAPLMETREGMSSPEVAKLFMLKAAKSGDPGLRDSVLEGSHFQGSDRVYLDALAELVEVESPSQITPVLRQDEAAEAYLDGDKDRAFELLAAGHGGDRRVGLLLRCALDIGTLRVAKIAHGEIEKLSAAEQETVRNDPKLSRLLESLEEQYITPIVGVPTGWLDWVRMVASGALDDNQAVELASQGAQEWSLDELATRPGDVAQLAEALIKVPDQRQPMLRLALPHLQNFLLKDEIIRFHLKPIFSVLLNLYAFDDARNQSTLRAGLRMLEYVVICGVSDAEYTDAIDLLEFLLDQGLLFDVVDDALDLLEALVLAAPARTPTVRVAFLVRDGLQRWWERLTRTQVELFNQLSREVESGVILTLPKSEEQYDGEPAGLKWLVGKVVALYSLNERALARVDSILKATVSGVRVLAFHDKVGGNQSLRDAARTADVFVIMTGAAKHAATGFIESNRGAGMTTLRTHGKGSASMLRVLQHAPFPI